MDKSVSLKDATKSMVDDKVKEGELHSTMLDSLESILTAVKAERGGLMNDEYVYVCIWSDDELGKIKKKILEIIERL